MVQPAGNLADEAYSAIREGILRGSSAGDAAVAPPSGGAVWHERAAGELRAAAARGGRPRRKPAARGTRVRIPSATDIRDLYELREALETQAARLFSQRATPAQRAELGRHAEQVDVLFNRLAVGDHEPLFRFSVHSHHVDFHMRIADYSGSRLLKQIMERKHVLIQNWLLDVAARRTPLPDGFHSSLAEALISSDADRADAAMRDHVRYGFTEIAGRIRALAASEWRERKPARRRRSDSQ